jgi:hypothetical protein
MVFITQDGDGSSDVDLIPDLFGPEWRVYSMTETEFASNWKVLAEGMLEGYHIRWTHHDTFFPGNTTTST